jgi:hypothetical protein
VVTAAGWRLVDEKWLEAAPPPKKDADAVSASADAASLKMLMDFVSSSAG